VSEYVVKCTQCGVISEKSTLKRAQQLAKYQRSAIDDTGQHQIWVTKNRDGGVVNKINNGTDWTLEGVSYIHDREMLPDKVADMHETDHFAVFSNGERLLFVPRDEVEP